LTTLTDILFTGSVTYEGREQTDYQKSLWNEKQKKKCLRRPTEGQEDQNVEPQEERSQQFDQEEEGNFTFASTFFQLYIR
jgi:archaellum component FlaC